LIIDIGSILSGEGDDVGPSIFIGKKGIPTGGERII
jgi:hypothetical protein